MIRYHYQNLDNRPGDGREATGSLLKHGRAWLYFGHDAMRPAATVRTCWRLFDKSAALQVSCSDEDGLTLHIAVPLLFQLFIGIHIRRLQKWYFKHDWKHLGVRVFDWKIWVDLWADDSCHSFRESFWHPHRRRFTIRPVDALFGTHKHAVERTIATETIVVAMPEASYRGTCRLEVETWKRPRWPWWPSSARHVRAHIDMQEPIPFPGKGENSWDCGEDATHGLTCRAGSVPEAIAAITESVLSSRRRNGGSNWVPAKHREAASDATP